MNIFYIVFIHVLLAYFTSVFIMDADSKEVVEQVQIQEWKECLE